MTDGQSTYIVGKIAARIHSMARYAGYKIHMSDARHAAREILSCIDAAGFSVEPRRIGLEDFRGALEKNLNALRGGYQPRGGDKPEPPKTGSGAAGRE